MVQQLGLLASTAGGPSSIPGQKTKIPKATQPGKKKKQNNPKPTNQPKSHSGDHSQVVHKLCL